MKNPLILALFLAISLSAGIALSPVNDASAQSADQAKCEGFGGTWSTATSSCDMSAVSDLSESQLCEYYGGEWNEGIGQAPGLCKEPAIPSNSLLSCFDADAGHHFLIRPTNTFGDATSCGDHPSGDANIDIYTCSGGEGATRWTASWPLPEDGTSIGCDGDERLGGDPVCYSRGGTVAAIRVDRQWTCPSGSSRTSPPTCWRSHTTSTPASVVNGRWRCPAGSSTTRPSAPRTTPPPSTTTTTSTPRPTAQDIEGERIIRQWCLTHPENGYPHCKRYGTYKPIPNDWDR